MQKPFQEWHVRKSGIDENKIRTFFHEREVWFAYLGVNVGFEQNGKGEKFLRPVVIIKKFNNEILWVIPTTKKNKTGKYYFNFSYKKNNSTTAILSQIRLIDSKRLEYKIGFINKIDFFKIKKRLISFFRVRRFL